MFWDYKKLKSDENKGLYENTIISCPTQQLLRKKTSNGKTVLGVWPPKPKEDGGGCTQTASTLLHHMFASSRHLVDMTRERCGQCCQRLAIIYVALPTVCTSGARFPLRSPRQMKNSRVSLFPTSSPRLK